MPTEMSEVGGIPRLEDPPASVPKEPWWQGLARRLGLTREEIRRGRARRVLLLLILLWLLNIFDLAQTILALRIGSFQEQNPLARSLLHAPAALAMYKVTLLLFATIIFVRFWRHTLTEIGCWFLASVYVGLAYIWLRYFYLLGH